MGRIRTIKPETPKSESLGNVGREARLCFIMLWTEADDEGRLRGHPQMLAGSLFPYDRDAPDLIEGWLIELEREGCIRRYYVKGHHYIDIPAWEDHQKIDRRTPSKLPSFDDRDMSVSEGSTRARRGLDESSRDISEGSTPEGKGRERIKEGSSDAYASAPPAPSPDPKAYVFGDLLAWLRSNTGRSEASLRSFLAKCCQTYGEEATAGAGMLVRAPPTPVEPLSAMKERLDRQAGKNGKKSTGPTPITNLYAGMAAALADRESTPDRRADHDPAEPLLDSG